MWNVTFPSFNTVRRVLAEDEEIRVLVMRIFKESGGMINRWDRSDRILMAEALIRGEDVLEMKRSCESRENLRRRIRDVRRKLEEEIL